MLRPYAFRAVLLAFLVAFSAPSGAHDANSPPEQLGRVWFASSCLPEVQASLDRGVALLHSFWFREGERAFRDVLARDPECAIAEWGIATALMGNPFGSGANPSGVQRAKEAIERGRAGGRKTERERYFIEAVAEYFDQFSARTHMQRLKPLSAAFEVLATRFPEDDEAQIFSAVYLTATQSLTDQSYAAALKAASILEVQFRKHPLHPGVAHYLIHSYDFPAIAEKGIDAAKRYAEIAPSAPHALHMPSHIFTRVGAWKESAATNTRSASSAKAQKEPNDQLHAMDYMVYAYLQLGQDAEARRVLEDANAVTDFTKSIRSGPYALAAMPARIALERGAWDEAAKLEPQESNFPFTRAQTYFARAIGAARSADPAAAEAAVGELARIVEGLKGKDAYWTAEVEVQRLAGAAWLEFARGNRDKGMALMRSAADLEDTSEKAAVTPARMLPARELLGDMLLAAGRPADALAEYEKSQLREPNRYRGLYGAGQAAAQAGNREKARHYFSQLVRMAGDGVRSTDSQAVRQYIARN
jgi:tetratricopeptide (TPR) repeat protein